MEGWFYSILKQGPDCWRYSFLGSLIHGHSTCVLSELYCTTGGTLTGYSILDIGHSKVKCPISNIQPTSRSSRRQLSHTPMPYENDNLGSVMQYQNQMMNIYCFVTITNSSFQWSHDVLYIDNIPDRYDTRVRVNAKTIFPWMTFHYKNKTVMHPSYPYDEDPYTGKTTFFYLDPPLLEHKYLRINCFEHGSRFVLNIALHNCIVLFIKDW